MSLSARVEELARAVVCVDCTDLPALVRLQDELTDLSHSLEDPDMRTLAAVCSRAAEGIERIVLRSADDVDAELAKVLQAVEYAQEVADAAISGTGASSVPPPSFMDSAPGPEASVDLELLSAWISSCASGLGELECAAVAIEAEEDPAQEAEARRIIHTIKGEAGILSLDAIQRVCHECETLIDLQKSRGEAFPVEEVLAIVDWVRACISALAQSATAQLPDHQELLGRITSLARGAGGAGENDDSVQGNDAETCSGGGGAESRGGDSGPGTDAASGGGLVEFPPEAVIDETSAEFVCEAREHIANAEQSLLDLESDLGNTELINTVFRAFHTIKGVAGFMHLTPVVRMTHLAETLLDKARGGSLALTPGHLDLFLNACDVLGQLIGAIQGAPAPTITAYERLMGRLNQECGSEVGAPRASAPLALSAVAPAAPVAVTSPAPRDGTPDAPGRVEGKPASSGQKGGGKLEQTVKVNTGRMDALVDMVGELVIGYQMVYQDEAIQSVRQQKTQRTLGHVAKIIRDLQEVAMSLRLVTLRPTFQKMARLVRDVSAKAGKDVRFHVEGEDVELDRTVVDEIADPLVHMIRNACDHGIEPAADRRASGKPEAGNICLRAYHSGGSIVIEIEDDGRGLDRAKIIGKAIERGIYNPDRPLAEIPDTEVFNLVLLPGFSTAEKVTDLSGRGVGMDVVRRNIESLRGKVDIRSTAGRGTVFSMRLPLTMAIIDGMIVRVGTQRYVIPTLSIEQSFRPKAGEIHTVVGRGEMAMVRGRLLPIHRLHEVLGHEGDGAEGDLLIVVESQDSRACLAVDEIIGQQQVVIKALGQVGQSIRGVSGGAILGDGRVALILDIGGILSEATAAA